MTLPIPPVTDHLAIALRAYAAPTWTEVKEPSTQRHKRLSRLRASPWTVIFDTETGSDAPQSLRIGTYQVREGVELRQAGIFYDPEGVESEEFALLQSYARMHDLRLITHAAFVEEIFYGIGYDTHANIVGFNLPFDISRIAIGHGSARGKMRGGFTFKLSPHPWTPPNRARPNVQVKHISRRSAFIQFASAGQPQSGAGQRKKRPVPTRRGHFIDVHTLAGALFARSFSLRTLAEHLKVAHPKLEIDDFGAPITDEFIGYAVRDVQTTWECYEAVMTRFARFGLTETGPNRIYSEAGIGKAYLKDMGVQPWTKMQPDFPRQLLANIMSSYFGGRSEVRIRREVRQVMLCDFLSMYPTVCILMGLWRFVIADGMTWRDATAETRSMLDGVDVAALQSVSVWKNLATIVRIKPNADIVPVRADYAGDGQTTIGSNYLTSEQPQWFTLADCIASKLHTGRLPTILEAVTFTPGEMQGGLKAITISGNADYRVDPESQDFYARVIALRQETKARMADSSDAGTKAELDIEQFALKIAANATSYGIFMEINVEDFDKAFSVTVHSGGGAPFSLASKKHERVGPYFHPLLGALITGAARLMLAITERLIADAGLEWAFCDTDSMAIAKPDHLAMSGFYEKVERIVAWFSELNPHGAGSILKIEDVNTAISGDGRTPLFVWAVSAKRYALFNLDPDGRPIIRKASQHGLGHLLAPYGDGNSAPNIPDPSDLLAKIGVDRWQHEHWWQIVSAALSGHPDQVSLDYHPAMTLPAISRYGATSPTLLRWFKRYNESRPYREQVKPFGFLTSLSIGRISAHETIVKPRRGRPRKMAPAKPIAPFDRDPAIAATKAFDRETNDPIPAERLRTYAQSLAQYHVHPEGKFLNGDYLDRGITKRRHIYATSTRLIGKESNDWEEMMYVGFSSNPLPDYGVTPDSNEVFVTNIRRVVDRIGRKAAIDKLAVSGPKLRAVLRGHPKAIEQLRVRLEPLLSDVARQADIIHERHVAADIETRESIARNGLRATARQMGIDPSNLRRKILPAGKTA